jgi:hypothetical protein
MKGAFFNKPLEWSIEITGESWQQGQTLEGILTVKNHATEAVHLSEAGVGLAFAEIKKVHARSTNAFKFEQRIPFERQKLDAGQSQQLHFKLVLPENSPVSDKKSSYFLTYGQSFQENHLQLKVVPQEIFNKIIGLMDTFFRFKLKEYNSSKTGVEFKLLPPTAREMANIEALLLDFSTHDEVLKLTFNFQVKKLDTTGVINKINKETVSIPKELSPRQYSLGKGMINQEVLLKFIEEVISEVKLKSVF